MTIPIKFQYSVESEVDRVVNTLKTKEWLLAQGYTFSLPQDLMNHTSEDNKFIKESVEKEFDANDYEIAERAITKSWNGNSKLIREINEKIPNSYILHELNVLLTKYGTQGSYIQPNSIIVNVSGMPPEFLIKTVLHESIHLMIESQIKENKVEHWVKERLVNLIMDLEFKSRFKMSPSPEWANIIDDVFKQEYPNLDLIMKKAPHAPSL
jgi:hypothetical protein